LIVIAKKNKPFIFVYFQNKKSYKDFFYVGKGACTLTIVKKRVGTCVQSVSQNRHLQPSKLAPRPEGGVKKAYKDFFTLAMAASLDNRKKNTKQPLAEL
jgi:hypothetical protein